ncbi:MAG: HAMP domain-containing histidine kinase, partial [Muribaculaceae bacterium]|nr:HAMP domain-containing histidine kinase [Muribaculaceae bacterium]
MDTNKTNTTAIKYRFPGKGKLRYQLKLFIISIVCLWGVVGVFAGLEYRNVKRYRVESLASSVDLAVGNILAGHDDGRDMRPFMSFLESYLEDSPLKGMSMSIYDAGTGRLLYSHGPSINEVPAAAIGKEPNLRADGTRSLQIFNIRLKDGRKIFLYNKGESADGEIIIHTYLPQSGEVDNALTIGSTFWLIVLFVGLVGTVVAWVVTAHQAKNITLLHDFASRAASDREFIPMGDFPKDEIGDISRQIVAIYNARMQANVRREREHVIALKATEEKNNLKRMMTNNISHELKTPIGIIRSYLEMILSNPDMSADERNYFLGKAQSNVERLVSMMNDLSTMTRLEESNGKSPISDIDFHDLVFSLAEDFTQSGLLKSMDFRY